MTRKDYERIAELIRIRFAREESAGMNTHALTMLVFDLAENFATENPRFNRARFMEACGLNPEA